MNQQLLNMMLSIPAAGARQNSTAGSKSHWLEHGKQLDPENFPEGDYVPVRCCKCGDKNRSDEGWFYRNDRDAVVEIGRASVVGLPMLSLLGDVRLPSGMYICGDCHSTVVGSVQDEPRDEEASVERQDVVEGGGSKKPKRGEETAKEKVAKAAAAGKKRKPEVPQRTVEEQAGVVAAGTRRHKPKPKSSAEKVATFSMEEQAAASAATEGRKRKLKPKGRAEKVELQQLRRSLEAPKAKKSRK